MKKLIAAGLGLLVGWSVSAEPLVVDAPIKAVGTPTTVAISSTTLTKVPSVTTQLSGRVGVYVSNPSTSPIAGFIGDCTSTALAATIRPFEFARDTANIGDASMLYIPLREDVCLWLISTDVTFASRNLHFQEVKK